MKKFSLLVSVVLLNLLLASCSNGMFQKKAKGSRPGVTFKAECERSGGKWVRSGTLLFYGCLRQAPDAGKMCTDSSQCTYNCNARPSDNPAPGQQAVGQCQTTNNYKGCHIELKNGIAKPQHCVNI